MAIKNYDEFSCLPEWASEPLEEHKEDEREYLYNRIQIENAETRDEYWNAAMNGMRHTGYLHNYMRMYWGKRSRTVARPLRRPTRRHFTSTTRLRRRTGGTLMQEGRSEALCSAQEAPATRTPQVCDGYNREVLTAREGRNLL